ncbi:Rab-GTPase-TBC domain [Pseudocohnilembus persalinus]|uniref:Rab-GTPase-TBC domain n=1 Tax=Pseudocohnilembus persalinus TaxID=266149 RepID=A0A0V0QEG6_PSEPJ|nr:Rab-GTPase-TBC domain [Pseudocohnilembus persalinus]|eukprot:KRX00606.1 Rab-GTPase-TBC domain [Pseudocohnilembus persalinus]
MSTQIRPKSKTTVNECTGISGTIEDFYQFKSPLQLVKIIFDKGKSQKFFQEKRQQKINRLGLSIGQSKDQKRNRDIKNQLILESKRLKIEEIFDKYYRQQEKNASNEPKKIFRYKLKDTLLTDQQRILVWPMACKVGYYQEQNKEYYKKLNLNINFPDNFKKQINNDIKRTKVPNQFEKTEEEVEEFRQQLYRILLNYSRRNSIIGYCQGYNYIVSMLLLIGFTEEVTFWIFTNLLEQVIPIDYYDSMLFGVICDQQIFNNLLQVHNPNVFKILEKNQISTGLFLTQWFVCLFAQTLNYEILKIAWDHMFLKGSVTLFKIGLIIMDAAQKQLQNAKGLEILQIIEQTSKEIKDPVWFNNKLNNLYISTKGVQILREIYRQTNKNELEKLEKDQKSNDQYNKLIDYSTIYCDKNWPYCTHIQQEEKLNKYEQINFFVFQQSTQLEIQQDYFPCLKIDPFCKSAKSSQIDSLIQSFASQVDSSFSSVKKTKKELEKEKKELEKEKKEREKREKKEKKNKKSKSMNQIDHLILIDYLQQFEKMKQQFLQKKQEQMDYQQLEGRNGSISLNGSSLRMKKLQNIQNSVFQKNQNQQNQENQNKSFLQKNQQKEGILITRTSHKCWDFVYDKKQMNQSSQRKRRSSQRLSKNTSGGKFENTPRSYKNNSLRNSAKNNSLQKINNNSKQNSYKGFSQENNKYNQNKNVGDLASSITLSYNAKQKIEEKENDSHSSSEDEKDQQKRKNKKDFDDKKQKNIIQEMMNNSNSDEFLDLRRDFGSENNNNINNNDDQFQLEQYEYNENQNVVDQYFDENENENQFDEEDDDYDNYQEDDYGFDEQQEDDFDNLNSAANSQEIDFMIQKILDKKSSRINQFFNQYQSNEYDIQRQDKLNNDKKLFQKQSFQGKRTDKGFSSDLHLQSNLSKNMGSFKNNRNKNQGSNDSQLDDTDEEENQSDINESKNKDKSNNQENSVSKQDIEQLFPLKFLRTLSMQPERKNFTKLLNIDKKDNEIISSKDFDDLIM